MQEQLNEKSIAIVIKAEKFTERILAKALSAYLNKVKKNNQARASPAEYKGKMSVKEIAKTNGATESLDLKAKNLKNFDSVARKYGVNYAVKKAPGEKGKFVVFFKSANASLMESAFKEYSAKTLKKSKPPLTEKLNKKKEEVAQNKEAVKEKVKSKNKEAER